MVIKPKFYKNLPVLLLNATTKKKSVARPLFLWYAESIKYNYENGGVLCLKRRRLLPVSNL